MSTRFRVCTNVATAIKNLGYKAPCTPSLRIPPSTPHSSHRHKAAAAALRVTHRPLLQEEISYNQFMYPNEKAPQ